MKRKLECDWRIDGIILLIENLISRDFKERMDFLGTMKFVSELSQKKFKCQEECVHYMRKEALKGKSKCQINLGRKTRKDCKKDNRRFKYIIIEEEKAEQD